MPLDEFAAAVAATDLLVTVDWANPLAVVSSKLQFVIN
jgi:hypothetical protein